MQEFLSKLLDLIREEIPFQRAEILLMDEKQRVFFREPATTSRTGDDEFILKIIQKALSQGSPVVVDSCRGQSMDGAVDVYPEKGRSVICIPLFAGPRVSGALFIERDDGLRPLPDSHLELLLSFIRPIHRILESRLELGELEEGSPEGSRPLLVGQSRDFQRILVIIDKVKDSEAPVFIYGESGTGKELVARAIHQRGIRCRGKFVAVNCGAIPDFLLESELFGHAKGAFTGAIKDKPGLIEEADGGTFFLDEVCDLPPHLQAKLLRLLQEREIRRIGENRTRRVDVRFISATNKNIEEQVKQGEFREDLYYRLKIIAVELPPLRQRKEDLFSLVNHFLDKYCREMGRERAYFTPRALERLFDYPWPGNVRELQSEIQRCLILSGNSTLIKEEHLSSRINPGGEAGKESPYDFAHAKAEFEKRFLHQALARWHYNRTKTAKAIGLSRQGLFKLIKKHRLELPVRKEENQR